ncbi:MAG: tRNA threonylcarbamoyladenosine biosynthesis protein TsaB, partial [Gammaproteobacteria bacterium]
MNILAIDTVTQACSVALLTETQRYQQARFEANTHSAFVLGMVDGVLKEAALSLADIDLIAVNNGPGSFTGIRIGVGVAQGLAYGANIPVLGINALAVLAAQSTESGSILSMIDARMGQVYWA